MKFQKLAAMFPSIRGAVETVVRAIDKDVLMQEISSTKVLEREERYQFT